MTQTAERPTAQRSSYRPFVVSVVGREQLSDHFVRITFAGADLGRCGDTCRDQRVKLVLAGAERIADLEPRVADPAFDWYGWWLALPDAERPPMRTYTLRAVRREMAEVDIDFACHGDAGPASRFALTARPGDRTVLVGPDAEVPESAVHGLTWHPEGATEVLLAGDETAVPAICGILETLPAQLTGRAFLEVPADTDLLDVHTDSGVDITWLARHDAPVGSRLAGAVRAWADARVAERAVRAAATVAEDGAVLTEPDGRLVWDEAPGAGADGLYVWLAGESGAITGLRRVLVKDYGLDRKAMSFMGYWKDGVAAVG